jgi:hypothetical protein
MGALNLSQFVLDPQFLLFQIVDDVVIGMWPPLFIGNAGFEIRVLGFQRLQMWLSWHTQPSRLAVAKLTLQTDWHRQSDTFSPDRRHCGAVCVGGTFTG